MQPPARTPQRSSRKTAAWIARAVAGAVISSLAACELTTEAGLEAGAVPDARAANEMESGAVETEAGPHSDTEPGEAVPHEPTDATAVQDSGALHPRDAGPAQTAPKDGGRGEAGTEDASNEDAHGKFPFPPFEAAGMPLAAPDRIWTYVEFPDTKCRDGSMAGISLNLNKSSRKLLIYLEGAAYCFDGLTCAINAESVDDGLYNSAKDGPAAGIFDLKNPQNPLRDWNMVYVPNCNGDGHGGTRTGATDVPGGPRSQYFVGHLNLQSYLHRIVPTFPDASDVLLAGISSGGYGVLQNLVLVQRAFSKIAVRYVNDSNPPPSKTVVAECLQDKMRTLWGLERGALDYCAGSCPNPRDYLEDNAVYLAKLLADRPGGYIEAIRDTAMMAVFGLGNDDCNGTVLLDSIPEATFRSALRAYRDKVKGLPNYGTFFPDATDHTWLSNNNFYTISADGVSLVDWFARIANGEPPGHAGAP